MRYNRELQPGKRRLLKVFALAALLILGCASAANAQKRTQNNSQKNQHQFTVVIDAGHGGHDFGAVEHGVNEKDVNLGVAKKLASLIKKGLKDTKVIMTRDNDSFISLQERANIANRNKGDLFISIHSNSVDKNNPNRRSVQGASVYALGLEKDANNLKVAQRENSVIELEENYHQKYSGFDPSKDESYIIFEMAQKRNLGKSLKFANKAQKELVATAGRNDRGVKQAGFWVLWATSMPSVLVELDFICNPDVAAFLDSQKGQEQLAEALYNAVVDYAASYNKQFADEVTGHGTTLHNQQASADLTAKATETENSPAPAVAGEDGVNTLTASAPKAERTRSQASKPANQTRSSGSRARKRRSDSSKTISDNRSFETGEIMLRSETDFMAVKDAPEQQAKEENIAAANTDKKDKKDKKNKKNKKDKNKDKDKAKGKNKDKGKQQSNSGKQLAQNEKKGNSSNPNRKTFVVSSKSNSQSTETATAATPKASANTAATPKASANTAATPRTSAGSAATSMVYKILLLVSDREMVKDDPAFCGLTPTGMFRENGKYKYTYGSSTNRREIEQKLMEIKSMMPNATIIVRME